MILLALAICFSIQAQMKPKKIKVKTDYTHSKTGSNFPLKIDQYNRTDIYTFDKEKQNIGVTYKANDLKTTVSVYLLPGRIGNRR